MTKTRNYKPEEIKIHRVKPKQSYDTKYIHNFEDDEDYFEEDVEEDLPQ